MVLEFRPLSARHAVHLSVMEQNGIDRILSFDSGVDAFPESADWREGAGGNAAWVSVVPRQYSTGGKQKSAAMSI